MNYPEHVRQKNWIGFEKNCEKFCEFCLVHIADSILLIFLMMSRAGNFPDFPAIFRRKIRQGKNTKIENNRVRTWSCAFWIWTNEFFNVLLSFIHKFWCRWLMHSLHLYCNSLYSQIFFCKYKIANPESHIKNKINSWNSIMPDT